MGNVFRCYVEKKPGFAVEAEHLFGELRHTLGLTGLTGVRVLRRYDVEGVDAAVYAAARTTVLSEPQVDALWDEVMPAPEGEHTLLAVEALPGQYDQRADSCAQCIQMMHGGERPTVRAATVYVLEGALTTPEAAKARGYLINPVESREAALDKPATLRQDYPVPAAVPVLDGFTALDRAGLESVLAQYALAMDLADLAFLQAYFRDEEGRDPTLTEVRVVDTYWSDHCRHTTFSTHLDAVEIADDNVKAAYERYLSARVEVYGAEKAAKRPQTLMDIATLGAKTLKKRGLLPELDESEEINACSIHVPAQVDGKEQDWLLMFKNETHNHPTEIEPFGGAATCIGGYTSTRPCASLAAATPAPRWSRPWRASCPSGRSPRPPRRATPPTATRSAWPPATWRSSTTRAMWLSTWSAARWWARPRRPTSAGSGPPPATW